ncbi:MAG: 23S rRNA (uracil(1939)-C(5))-methyltransferase RlmD [Dethiosulfovibrio peptidovorans]|nr:MAG: 23S rRNA (uracil(1939)-C(5))-methyltransferase RlmD [Dethiosulfovibrio peptidovorans]
MIGTVRDVNSRGQGVLVPDDGGKVYFVDGVLPGEMVRLAVISEKKGYGVGRLVELLEPSPHRVTPRCSWFGRCGGCQLQHGSYDVQLRIKENAVRSAMERLAGVQLESIVCEPSPSAWGYRNKASFPVQFRKGGRIGFFRVGSHELVPIDGCPVLMPHLDGLYRSFRSTLLPSLSGSFRAFYDERRNRGMLRHVVFRGNRAGQSMIMPVVTSLRDRVLRLRIEKGLRRVRTELSGVGSALWNINPRKGNRILGDETVPIWGDGLISEVVSGAMLQYDGTAFFQVNPDQVEALFRYAAHLAAELDGSVVELYAGVGALTSLLARQARSVLAVEEWLPAVERLSLNMEANGLDNVRALCGRAEDLLPQLTAERPQTVVLDPPRSGCASEVMDAVDESTALRLLYVSCNPATLARDVRIMMDKGWKLRQVRSFDLFPQTCHVETVCLMSR